MRDKKEQDRKWAIERYLAKESPASIYTSMGYSKAWFFKWLEHYRTGEEDWFRERARRPLQNPNRTPQEITQLMSSAEELKKQSLLFEHRHNSRYRYSKLKGRTPMQSLVASGIPLRFPDSEAPPKDPLPRPETGCYHLIRFIRSDGLLDVFGEKFKVPPECVYEYVRATVEVSEQKLCLHLGELQVDELEYAMR